MTGGYFSSLLMIIQTRGRLTAVGELELKACWLMSDPISISQGNGSGEGDS